MNGVILFFIGLPLVVGVIYRFKTFEIEQFKKSALISGAVFASVGVGYVFTHYGNASNIFDYFSDRSRSRIIFVLWGGCSVLSYLVLDRKTRMTGGTLIFYSMVISFIATIAIMKNSDSSMVVVLVFIGAGVFNAALGSIGAGFTLTVAAHALVSGHTLNDIFIWKEFFEFFEIRNIYMMGLMLVTTSLLSVSDIISGIFEQ
jgi:hypothetical protein